MGYIAELNTLLGLPQGFDTSQLKVGGKYIVLKARERFFPLHKAIIMVSHGWNFLGYAVAHSLIIKEYKSEIEFEVISLFSEEMQKIYKSNFLKAVKKTGELK